MRTFMRHFVLLELCAKWQEQKASPEPSLQVTAAAHYKRPCRPNQSEATFGIESLSSSARAYTF